MNAPTHASIAGLTYVAGCAILDVDPSWQGGAAALAGALLPDVDTPNSVLGKPLWFLSERLERRFGHRTVTHSFFGYLAFLALSFPLFFVSPSAWCGLAVGYLSHLLSDCWTKGGVQFFWPMNAWGVFPQDERHRLSTGSKAESAVLLLSLLANAAVMPVAVAGTSRTLHFITGSVRGAVEDYYEYSPSHRTFVEVEGVVKGSGKPLQGRFPVVAGLRQDSLLIQRGEDLLVVGPTQAAQVLPRRLWLERGDPVVRYEQVVEMDGRQLSELSVLEGSTHRLFGRLRFLGDVEVPQVPWRFSAVKRSGSELVLEYATWEELESLGLGGVLIVGSRVQVVRELPPEERYVPLKMDGAPGRVVVLEFDVESASDVLVEDGDVVGRGDVLAANSKKARRVSLLESEIESRRKLRREESSRVQGELVVMEEKAARLRSEIQEQELVAAKYREHPEHDFSWEIQRAKDEAEELRLELLELRQREDEARSRDAAAQLRYEQDVARLAAELHDLRSEVYLHSPVEGRVVGVSLSGSRASLTLRPAPGNL